MNQHHATSSSEPPTQAPIRSGADTVVPECAHTCWFVGNLVAASARRRGLPEAVGRLEAGLRVDEVPAWR